MLPVQKTERKQQNVTAVKQPILFLIQEAKRAISGEHTNLTTMQPAQRMEPRQRSVTTVQQPTQSPIREVKQAISGANGTQFLKPQYLQKKCKTISVLSAVQRKAEKMEIN